MDFTQALNPSNITYLGEGEDDDKHFDEFLGHGANGIHCLIRVYRDINGRKGYLVGEINLADGKRTYFQQKYRIPLA